MANAGDSYVVTLTRAPLEWGTHRYTGSRNRIYGRYDMAVSYDKLFHLLIDKRITNAQLADKAGISANIITRIKKNEYISLESIEKLCQALECRVDDILEFTVTEND